MPTSPAGPDPNLSSDPGRDGEAATAITDVLLALQSAFFVYRLGSCAGCQARAVRCWRAAFAAAGLAAAAGAAYHAPSLHGRLGLRTALWKGIGVATGIGGTLLLVGGIVASSSSAWRRIWIAAAWIKSALLGVITWRRADFRYVIYDYGSSLVALFALQLWRPGPASPAIRRGILLSFLAAAVQQKGPALHRRFDHNALYHVVQMVALYFLERGAQQLRDR